MDTFVWIHCGYIHNKLIWTISPLFPGAYFIGIEAIIWLVKCHTRNPSYKAKIKRTTQHKAL